jgi:hypothetical protein
VVLAYVIAAVMFMAGVALIVSDARRWHPLPLGDQLDPFAATTLAGEAEDWFRQSEDR